MVCFHNALPFFRYDRRTVQFPVTVNITSFALVVLQAIRIQTDFMYVVENLTPYGSIGISSTHCVVQC